MEVEKKFAGAVVAISNDANIYLLYRYAGIANGKHYNKTKYFKQNKIKCQNVA